MNFDEITIRFSQKVWFSEFIENWRRIDNITLGKISRIIFLEIDKHPLDSLYEFGRFLFDVLYNKWSGTLNPEIVYLATKILVLMGLNSEAIQLSRSYSFHPGCCAWRLGSLYRNNGNTLNEKNTLLDLAETFMLQDVDQIIQIDLLTWIAGFKSYDILFNWYTENEILFKSVLPYIILIDRAIYHSDIKKANELLIKTSELTTSKIEHIMLMNKKAVLCQIHGNQKQAFKFFELVQEESDSIGDVLSTAKASFNQASSYFLVDEYDLSLQLYQKAESTYKLLNDLPGIGKCYNALSSIYTALGEYSIAERYITLCKQIFISNDNKVMLNGILYKNAYLLYIKGEYKSTLQILEVFNQNEISILNFQVNILKITALFESERIFDENRVDLLNKMVEKLSYKIGKALLDLEISRIHSLKGNLKESEMELDSAYKVYQALENHRGIIRSLIINSFIEILKGNVNDAQRFCETALNKAENNNLFLERIESNILLANILFLKNFPRRALNILETVIYLLEVRNMKNSFYLQAIYTKCNLENFIRPSLGILNNDLVSFIQKAKNSSSLYWIDQSKLLEAEEFLRNKNFQNVLIITKDLLERSTNYEMRFQARKLNLKSQLGMLREDRLKLRNKEELEKQLYEVKKELIKLENDISEKSLIIHEVEFKLIEIEYLQTIGEEDTIEVKIESLEKIIIDKQLFYYNKELQEIKQSNCHAQVKFNVQCLLSI